MFLERTIPGNAIYKKKKKDEYPESNEFEKCWIPYPSLRDLGDP